MDYELVLQRVMADPRYLKNMEYGQPRPGHPEGSVRAHIAELESNLEQLKPRLSDNQDYWKLKFIVHVHDTFKAEAAEGVAIVDSRSHASLAKAFAQEYTEEADLLNIIQYHDEGYALWQQFHSKGRYNVERLAALVQTIQDWDLYLAFIITDGNTPGKDTDSLRWFINLVRPHVSTKVDETWIPAQPPTAAADDQGRATAS